MDITLLEDSFQSIRKRWQHARPYVGLILGSGWSEVAAAFKPRDIIEYEAIDGLGATGVEGHAGELIHGELAGLETLIFRGRRHWYEGVGWTPVALPVYFMKSFGVKQLLLTNAAGALNPEYRPGNIMLLRDHLNLMGANPLIGPHCAAWGTRFPDMSAVYDSKERSLFKQAAAGCDLKIHEGVYCALSGPSFETPAEIRMLKTLGADAVGMSTVPEAILANAVGIKVSALSCISNLAAGISDQKLSHQEVFDTVQGVLPEVRRLIENYWKELSRTIRA